MKTSDTYDEHVNTFPANLDMTGLIVTSSDTNILTVTIDPQNSHNVTFTSTGTEGTVTVTASLGGLSATVSVTTVEPRTDSNFNGIYA